MKPMYQMCQDIEALVGKETTARILRFYAACRGKVQLEMLEQTSWRKAIKALAYYEKFGRPTLRKDESLISAYNEFLAIEAERLGEQHVAPQPKEVK